MGKLNGIINSRATCAREQCPLWSSIVQDDGGVKEGCVFKLMAER